MPNFIVIESKKETAFNSEAITVLESSKFSLVNTGTYMGSSGASTVATKLKNLESYKKNHTTAGIKIYYGSLSS
jgi:hypothetical protein